MSQIEGSAEIHRKNTKLGGYHFDRSKNLVKKYGNHLAVDHLDFQIKPGMVYGFESNGAGKSTTMNIMTGCMGATQGKC